MNLVYGSIFCKYKEMTEKEPGGKEGADFSIERTGSGKINTKYTVKKVKETTLTKDEIAMIKEKGLYKLQDLFKAVPAEKIESVLFGEDTTSDKESTDEPSEDPVQEDSQEDSEDLGF